MTDAVPRMTYKYSLGFLAALGLVACADDGSATGGSEDSSSSTGDATTTLTTSTSADSSETGTGTTTSPSSSSTEESSTTVPAESSSEDSGPPPMPAEFMVQITNISGTSVLPSELSAGIWLEQEFGSVPVFDDDAVDRDEGLVTLAEDGDPGPLAASMMAVPEVVQSGTWDTPLAPGESTEFTFTAQPGDRLSLMTALGTCNDCFIGTGPLGVALFANNGDPLADHDVSDVLRIWEVGSEYTQAPGQGADQRSTQAALDTGMDEAGTVVAFNSSTRALPQANQVVEVDVDADLENPGSLIITITNLGGTVAADLSPMVWALHEDTVSIVDGDLQASAFVGLEELAEDGDPSPWQIALAATPGVASAATIDTPAGLGESFVFNVTPTTTNRMLSFATSIVASNDAFVAPRGGGIALVNADGTARTNAQIEEDFVRDLAVWDAGTEANEVPGVGSNIQSEQLIADTGAVDPVDAIRPFLDSTNDLAGEAVGGTFTVTVAEVAGGPTGDFEVTIENTSGGTAYPAVFSPVLWAVHDDTVTLFTAGMPASPSLETLAEDADPSALLGDLMGDAAVSATDVDVMPLGPGATFQFTVVADAQTPFLSVAAMVLPSNDSFVAFAGGGVRLVDDAGDPLSESDIAAAILAQLGAWESGTEANQAGAIGRDQAPRQAADNTGANEGNTLVRSTEDDPIWAWPAVDQLVLVTIAPTGN